MCTCSERKEEAGSLDEKMTENERKENIIQVYCVDNIKMKWILRKVNEHKDSGEKNYKLIGKRRKDMSRYGGKQNE